MADLVRELAELNKRAEELLQKYDQAFTRLDEKSQELADQLVKQINDGLSQLESLKTSGETNLQQKIDEGSTLLQQKIDDGITQLVAKIQNGLDQLQAIIETGAFPRVVSKPVITGGATVAIGHETTWTVSAKSYLDEEVHIDHFEVFWGDGSSETVPATGNQAQISHAFSGNAGDTLQISVVAVDNLGNKSEPATLEIQLVDNRPPTAPQIDAPSQIIQGQTEVIKLYGSTDPDGDPVSYKIVDTGLFTFSKTENIVENEEVQITAPSVDSDTTSTIKAVAVDDKGLMSPMKNFEILIKKLVWQYGVVDIFGDGSCILYATANSGGQDLSGVYGGKMLDTRGNPISPILDEINGIPVLVFNQDRFLQYSLQQISSGKASVQVVFAVNVSQIPSSYNSLFHFPSGYGSDQLFALYTYGDGTVRLWLGNGTDDYETRSSITNVNDGNLHVIIATSEGDVYLDAEQIISNAGSADMTTVDRPFIFGGDYNGGPFPNTLFFSGYLAQIRVFNKILSPTEIEMLTNEINS